MCTLFWNWEAEPNITCILFVCACVLSESNACPSSWKSFSRNCWRSVALSKQIEIHPALFLCQFCGVSSHNLHEFNFENAQIVFFTAMAKSLDMFSSKILWRFLVIFTKWNVRTLCRKTKQILNREKNKNHHRPYRHVHWFTHFRQIHFNLW